MDTYFIGLHIFFAYTECSSQDPINLSKKKRGSFNDYNITKRSSFFYFKQTTLHVYCLQ